MKTRTQTRTPFDAPTRLLTWAIRRWKERTIMADEKLQPPQHGRKLDAPTQLTAQTQSLYFNLRSGQKVELTPFDRAILMAALEYRYPVLKRQARAAEKPPLKERLKWWGNALYYASLGLLIVSVIYLLAR